MLFVRMHKWLFFQHLDHLPGNWWLNMALDISGIRNRGREPLQDYPWRGEIDRLLSWLLGKDSHVQAFCFDLVMSAAYLDAASGLEKHIESCNNCPGKYNSHMGFVNLCSPCYVSQNLWTYQKAVKPQSGALGKLSSEIILRFIERLYPKLEEVLAIGGIETADAILIHNNRTVILAEVKSAPLLTYPFVFQVDEGCISGNHNKLVITQSQLRYCESAIYLHNDETMPLGKVGSDLWPFKPLVDFLIDPANQAVISGCINDWLSAREAYTKKDRTNRMYFLANASGHPPKAAKDIDNWPRKESISDSKTSVGMDRTDDIKKGIYQTLKIGTLAKADPNIKTAIISNLPAYRHGTEYIMPFQNMFWGLEEDIVEMEGQEVLTADQLRRVFDFIITLEEPVLRNIKL